MILDSNMLAFGKEAIFMVSIDMWILKLLNVRMNVLGANGGHVRWNACHLEHSMADQRLLSTTRQTERAFTTLPLERPT